MPLSDLYKRNLRNPVIVEHKAVAARARPKGAKWVIWVGTVTPTNKVAGDLLINSSTNAVTKL